MATNQEKAPASPKLPEGTLFVMGTPVVVTGSGERLSLSGEITAEQRKQLGDVKLLSLWQAGHLQTQEQIDAAEAQRQELDSRRPPAGYINPNFGTPSMTPEAAAKNAPSDFSKGGKSDKGSGDRSQAGGDWRKTPVDAMGLDARIVSALQASKINTADDIIAHGDKEGTLTDIEGIGEKSEEEIQASLKKLSAGRL